MIETLLRYAIDRRWLIMCAAVLVAAIGVWSYQSLPIDAVPDITNVQVQINTQAQGYSPLEVEQRITYPVETAIAGLPHLEYTRSLSRYGLSQVTVVFDEGTDVYFARNLINERLQQVRAQLPEGVEAELGPIATGLGEIFLYTVHADPEARQPNGQPYDATATANAAGLGDPTAIAPGRGRHRSAIRSAATNDSSTLRPIPLDCSPTA